MGRTKAADWPLIFPNQIVAGCDTPVQQERGVNLELTTPIKLKKCSTKNRENKLIKSGKQSDLFLGCDYIFILV